LIQSKTIIAPLAAKQRPLRCRWDFHFFGLSNNYIEEVYERFFFLSYYGGWSFLEAYNLPIPIRNWFVKRLIKQKKREMPEDKQEG